MQQLPHQFSNLHVEGLLKILSKNNATRYEWNRALNKLLNEGKIKDAHFLFNRMPRDAMYRSTMITGLCKFGKVKEARQVFDEMRESDDTMAWTSMITGYASNSHLEEARALLNRMPVKDLVPIKFLIRKYMQCNKVPAALKLFEENGMSDLETANSMVVGFCQNGMIKDAQNFFDRTKQRNVVTWTSLMSEYAEAKNLDAARQLFDEMPEKNVVSWNAMLSGYANNGKMDEAQELFDAREIFDKSPTRDIVSWNAMVAGYAQNGYEEEALRMFVKMKRLKIRPTESTFVSVLSAWGFLSTLEEGKQLHGNVIKEMLRTRCHLDSALVAMYSRCGNIGDAKKCFEKTSKMDVITWNAMIAGYAQHGMANEALEVLEKMLASGTKPSSGTFVGGLKACSHARLVDQGTSYFQLMRQVYGIKPTVEHYGCMVDLLARAGKLEEAREIINTMPFEADAIFWGSLLGACRGHRNHEMGKC